MEVHFDSHADKKKKKKKNHISSTLPRVCACNVTMSVASGVWPGGGGDRNLSPPNTRCRWRKVG